MKNYSIFKITFWLSLTFLFAACSTDDSNPTVDLKLAEAEINLKAGESTTIDILSGNGDYKLRMSNPDLLSGRVQDDQLELTAKAISHYAEAKVYVTDAANELQEITVFIEGATQLQLAKDRVVFNSVQQEELVSITGLGSTHAVQVIDQSIVNASIVDDELILTAKKRGTTRVIIEDSYAGKAELVVEVSGEPMALNFSDNIFGYANFEDVTAVDQSIKELKQVTFEMTCKIDSYRGLQTFMGLEGQLIVRGKNDDYRETHPIQIAGLGDRIMLESTSSFKLDEWMHIALVVDCSKSTTQEKYKLYINGNSDPLVVVREEETHSKINLASSNEGNRFVVGRAFGQDWRVIRGMVSQVRVWKQARTADQIAANLCDVEANDSQDLLALWDFSTNMDLTYIQDSSPERYQTNLYLADAKKNNQYNPITVTKETFVPYSCEF